jgi:zinc/manganese transport system permease protein
VSLLTAQLFEPGFFGNDTVRTALIVGGIVAAVSACVGVFTVIRNQAFTGEALGDFGATGGSAAYLVGIANPLWGFVVAALAGATAIEALGVRNRPSRDLATGIVLGAGLGLAALFLYLDTTSSSTSGVTITILFGSLFAIDRSLIPTVAVLGLITLALIVVCYRMLLLGSLSSDLAAARGVPVRLVGAAYVVALALAVALAALTIGAILSTALLIGPPAAALRLAKQPGLAMLSAVALGVGATWLGILLAYDSYYWPPVDHGWPVSFLIVAVVFTVYLLAQLAAWLRQTRRSRPASLPA